MSLIRVYIEPVGYKDIICHSVEISVKNKTAKIVGGEQDGIVFTNVRGAKVIKDHPCVQGELELI